MILPGVNLLIYAHDSGSRWHSAAKAWWENCLSGTETVGLPWAVSLGFIRLITNPRIFERPLPVESAIRRVRSWLERPQVQILQPGPRHADLVFSLLIQLGTAASMTTDAHLAALAQEHQASLHTADTDFARFPGLRWMNPLSES